MKRGELVKYLDRTLNIRKYKKKFPASNGLLIKGKSDVRKIGAAVNITIESIEKAKKGNVDFLITHHGAWKWLDPFNKKIIFLKKNKISLYCCHESLDQEYRISIANTIAKLIGMRVEGKIAKEKGDVKPNGVYGTVNMNFNEFIRKLSKALNYKCKFYRYNNKLNKLAIVNGGGGKTDFIVESKRKGCNTYLTGEGNMFTRIITKELNMNLIYGSHYATEVIGTRDLLTNLGKKFHINKIFIKEENLG